MFPLLSIRWLTCTTNSQHTGFVEGLAVHDQATVDIFQENNAGDEYCVTYERSERGLPPQRNSQKTRRGQANSTHITAVLFSLFLYLHLTWIFSIFQGRSLQNCFMSDRVSAVFFLVQHFPEPHLFCSVPGSDAFPLLLL